VNDILKKILIIAGIVLIIGALIFVFFFYKGTIVFNPSPETARIDINGVSLTGQAKIKLNPGSYHMTISSPDYVDYTKIINIGVSQKINLNIALKKLPVPEKILDDNVQFLSKSLDGNLFYLGNSGKTIYRMTDIANKDLRKSLPITPDVFENIKYLAFSSNYDLAILKKDNNTILYDFMRYDLLHQELHDWGGNIGYIIWSPDGNKIAYYYQTSQGEKTLISANKDNSTVERIYNFKDTNITNPKLVWSPDGNKILVIKDDIYIFDIYTKTLTQVTNGGGVTDATFSPDSKNILYNHIDSTQNISLLMIDIDGKNIRDLTVKTYLDKIAWIDEKNMILAIPDTETSSLSDRIVKINTDTFSQEEYDYASKNGKISPSNIIYDKIDNYLFFLANNNLYSLDLSASKY
jgi:hypothetical protein